MICPKCSTDNRDGAKFCDECGARLDAAASGPLDPRSIPTIDVAGVNVGEDGRPFDAARAACDGDECDVPYADDEAAAEAADGAVSADAGDDAPVDGADDEGDALEAGASSDAAADAEAAGGEEDASDDADAGEGEGEADAAGEPQPRTSPFVPAAPDDAMPAAFAPKPIGRAGQASAADADATADLSGLDEYLVAPGYVPPQGSWRSGDTMQMPRIESDGEEKKRDFRAPDANKKKGRAGRAVAAVLVVLAIIGAGAAGATYYLELWGGKVLPDVVGMTQTDATYVLQSKGFAVRTTAVTSDETEGTVLLMDPGAGAREEEGSEVVIHIAQARIVPDVAGKTQAEAEALLAAEGFENVTVATERTDAAEGSVLSIEPAAGEKAKAGAAVTLTVAVPYTVPDISGMSYDEAVAAIEAAGLAASSAYVYSETAAEGSLAGTSPAAGEKVAGGSTVVINIVRSRATELVAAAQAYLQSAGSVTIGGTTYAIQSVDGVSYTGDNTTAFTITGVASTVLDGETVYGSARQRMGTIVWDDDNNIVSIS